MINIYGKGGHAKMTASLVKDNVSFYNDEDYHLAKDLSWIIGVGNNEHRQNIVNKLNDVDYLSILSGLYIADDAIIGIGVLIAPGAVIQNDVIIGDHTIVNTSASIDHNCIIGSFCHIAPNSTLCGSVKIGKGTLIGAGSVVLSGVKIGEHCIIGAGSVVVKNIPSNTKAYGNPAKIV